MWEANNRHAQTDHNDVLVAFNIIRPHCVKGINHQNSSNSLDEFIDNSSISSRKIEVVVGNTKGIYDTNYINIYIRLSKALLVTSS